MNACPCPCPLEPETDENTWGFLVNTPDSTLEPGDIIDSATGLFQFEVLSYPFSRLYYDVKGDFEKYSLKKLSSEELPDLVISFFNSYREGGFTFPPSYERLLYTAVFAALFSSAPTYEWLTYAINLTHKPMFFKDNSPWILDEKSKWVQGKYPCSYMVKIVGLASKPIVRTIRWDAKVNGREAGIEPSDTRGASVSQV